jgi:hypothetical protein
MKQSKRSHGFSLILSLTVMAGIVMLLVTVSAFVMVESRAVMNQQLATRAKLNSIVAMRLALAHLQQEAGPDRRSTARADITQPDATATTVRNPMWTGIWRTDLPDLPPAWLVSGRANQPAGTQSTSLYQTSLTPDYHLGYWAPWQSDYAPSADQLVTLVGLGSALGQDGSTPSGLVSLPKIELPDNDVDGAYAYWVGDEGVKARPNLIDTRAKADTNSANQLIAARSPVTHGLLKNLPNQIQLAALSRMKDAPLLTDWKPEVIGDGFELDTRKYFHDISLVSAGVLSDPVLGGLKRDLSGAFELSDARFAITEFGQGAVGAAGTSTEKGTEPVVMPVLQRGSQTTDAAPVFNRTVAGGNVRGPTWWALRDYHRLYKQVGWTSGGIGERGTSIPTLQARTLWPNAAVARPSGPPGDSGNPNNSRFNRTYAYSDLYNGDLPTPINPNASDYLNGDRGRLITRPLNVAATPYVQRVTLAFSVNKMHWFEWKRIRWGKNWVWVEEEWVDIRVNITPIVVVHNPFNVRMAWQPKPDAGGSPNADAFATAISVSDLNGWKFRFKQYKPGTMADPHIFETDLTKFLNLQDGTSDAEDTLRLYLKKDDSVSMIIEPGESRVFSCKPTIGDWSKSVVLDNTYDTRGGFRDTLKDWGFGEDALGLMDLESPIALSIVPGSRLRIRHALACWPGDQLDRKASPGASDKLDFFNKSSESTEVVFTDINPTSHPLPAERFYPDWRAVPDKYLTPPGTKWPVPDPSPAPPLLEPDLVTAFEISVKTADSVAAPYATFTHSNPLAPTQRASATGRNGTGGMMGVQGISPSFQLNLRGGSWLNVLETDPMNVGKVALGGNSMTATGSTRVILCEVPLTQPTSLAQFGHANFGVRDQQPLLGIGNSFASPLVDARKVIQDNGPDWTDFDQTYLLNTALWDGFFLSSLAPWMKTGTTGDIAAADPLPTDPVTRATATTPAPVDPNEQKSLSKVIEDFVLTGQPLDNPRFSIEHTDLDAVKIQGALGDYRRAATVLTNKGAFNVNSTSVAAWKSFLGSAKELAVATLTEKENSARFRRVVGKVSSGGIQDLSSLNPGEWRFDDSKHWDGFASLTDVQLTELAKGIVAENKARFAVLSRTERDLVKTPGTRLFGGLTQAATPYLGLSEFINRFLCDQTWASRCGALQSAIFRADRDAKAGLSHHVAAVSDERQLTLAKLTTTAASRLPHPENIEAAAKGSSESRVHSAFSAPGNLLQSDLLQSLGSALASRSDTFKFRCYGEAAQTSGKTGSAWLEVIVQRVPGFIDPTNAAETGNSASRPLMIPAALPSNPADVTVDTALTPVNHLLGRRFKVISMRWLRVDEI